MYRPQLAAARARRPCPNRSRCRPHRPNPLLRPRPPTGEQLHHVGDDPVQRRLQRLVGWRGHFDEVRFTIDTAPVHAVRTRQCRRMLSLAADPKHWINVTAPLSTISTSSPPCPSRVRVITQCITCITGVTHLGCAANSRRNGIGSDSDSTHWRAGGCWFFEASQGHAGHRVAQRQPVHLAAGARGQPSRS